MDCGEKCHNCGCNQKPEQKRRFETVGDLKRAIAALPAELDDKPLWFIELISSDTGIHVGEMDDVGVSLTGE